MPNLLGVDFGTTSLKACLFNEKGERLKVESCKYQLKTNGEFIEFPVNDFFKVFKDTLDKITKEYKVDALSIDTQGETLIVLDEKGNPLMDAIIWLDNRASVEAKEFEEKFGMKTVYEWTGQAEVPSGYPAPKIMWIKKNRPEIFEKADKFLLLEDYILYRLTGKFCASRSLYSSSLLMDIKKGAYIKDVLDYVGITENNLPTLYESGVIVGEYNGIKITTSALDQIAGITGAGVIKEGIMSETTGTCLSVCAVTNTLPKYYDGLKVSAYYVKKGLFCLLMWSPTAGATLEWFKKNFCDNLSFDELNALVEKTPKGSEGLICIPHLCGTVVPENNPKVKGVFFGMEMKHGKGHFVRAIMESIAYTIKEYVDLLKLPIENIISVGGGSKSEIWCKIKSAVLGKDIKTLCESETACLGSAVFAGVGNGTFISVEDAVKELVKEKNKYSSSEDYSNLYADYKKKEKELFNLY